MSLTSTLGSIAAGLLKSESLRLKVASADALDVRQFHVFERANALFSVSVTAVSPNAEIPFDAIIGAEASFAISYGTGERRWEGVCNHIELIGTEPRLSTYRVTIVPELWLLSQRRNYRMFQQLAEPDIALEILADWNIEAELRLDKGAYKKRKYRVQYGESDFSFVCRMLEDAGITFFFEQQGRETKLVLSDSPWTARPRRPLPFHDDAGTGAARGEMATNLAVTQRVRPGKYTIRDHDARLDPKYSLAKSATLGLPKEARLERYHYRPGAFLFGSDKGPATPVADDRGKTRTDEGEGEAVVQRRLHAKRGAAKVITFETNVVDVAPGTTLTILDHPRPELASGRALLVLESTLSGSSEGSFSCQCEARTTDVPHRPPLVTPKPVVAGVESATVVGPQGEEIHTDELGRVRVHFHWDRDRDMNEKSSCWIHVSQPWGGTGYGGVNIPRVGQEVLVEFLGGDPDRPIIVGRVYTALQKVPYKLPHNKTQSGWRSNSTNNTGGYNEVMFEDAAGKELLRVQAERDMSTLVKHDEGRSVGSNRTTVVGANDSTLVGSKHELTIAAPGGDKPAPGPTVMSMVHENATLTTGQATVTLAVADISLAANGNIDIRAGGKITLFAGKGVEIRAAADDVVIHGDPKVKINCSE